MNLKSIVTTSILLHGKHGYDYVYKDIIKRLDKIGENHSEEEIFKEYEFFAKKRIYYSEDEIITYEIIGLGYSAIQGQLKRYEKKTCKRLSQR